MTILKIFLQLSENKSDSEDDIDTSKVLERTDADVDKELEKSAKNEKNNDAKSDKMYYKKLSRHYLADEVRKENREAVLTTAAYHQQTKILVVGNLIFFLNMKFV